MAAFLDGLVKAPWLNHHLVEVIEGAPQTEGGRVAVRVLSSGDRVSVRPGSIVPTLAARRGGGHARILPHACAAEPVLRRLVGAAMEQHTPDAFAEPELIDHVLSFLALLPVEMEAVRAVGASSAEGRDRRCSPASSLDPSSDNWWISAWNSMPNGRAMPDGRGAQYVEYELGPQPVVVSTVHLTIPPLPSGPLSVRCFHLQTSNDPPDGGTTSVRRWERASADMYTLDVGSRQSLALVPPIEAKRFVRIVCTLNAAAAAMGQEQEEGMEMVEFDTERVPTSIGFFCIAFE